MTQKIAFVTYCNLIDLGYLQYNFMQNLIYLLCLISDGKWMKITAIELKP